MPYHYTKRKYVICDVIINNMSDSGDLNVFTYLTKQCAPTHDLT